MTIKFRSCIYVLIIFGAGSLFGVIINHYYFSKGLMASSECLKLTQEASDKCIEADRLNALFEKKYPNSNDDALASPEWERYMAWRQACDDTKEQLLEMVRTTNE